MTDSQYHAGLDEAMAEFGTYTLSLECELHDEHVGISVQFDSVLRGGEQVVLLMQMLVHIVRQLYDADLVLTKLAELDLVPQQDLEQIGR